MSAKKDPIEALIEQENWVDAARAIQAELKTDPNNHWLLTRLSTTYYEERDWHLQLAVATHANFSELQYHHTAQTVTIRSSSLTS